MIYIVEEHLNLYGKLGVAVGFDSSSSINNSDETFGCELLPLSCVCSIEDEVPRFREATCEEELSCDRFRSIKN